MPPQPASRGSSTSLSVQPRSSPLPFTASPLIYTLQPTLRLRVWSELGPSSCGIYWDGMSYLSHSTFTHSTNVGFSCSLSKFYYLLSSHALFLSGTFIIITDLFTISISPTHAAPSGPLLSWSRFYHAACLPVQVWELVTPFLIVLIVALEIITCILFKV